MVVAATAKQIEEIIEEILKKFKVVLDKTVIS